MARLSYVLYFGRQNLRTEYFRHFRQGVPQDVAKDYLGEGRVQGGCQMHASKQVIHNASVEVSEAYLDHLK